MEKPPLILTGIRSVRSATNTPLTGVTPNRAWQIRPHVRKKHRACKRKKTLSLHVNSCTWLSYTCNLFVVESTPKNLWGYIAKKRKRKKSCLLNFLICNIHLSFGAKRHHSVETSEWNLRILTARLNLQQVCKCTFTCLQCVCVHMHRCVR